LRPRPRPLQGIAYTIAAVACFAALDTSTKYISHAVPLVMALWCRYLLQAVATAAVMLPRQGRSLLRTRRPGLQLLRGVLLLACSMCAFMSFRHMPVGDVTAIGLLTPVVVTVLAVLTTEERLSPLRFACVVAGFAGALIVVRPGGAMFGWAILMPLGMVATNTAFQIITGRLANVDAPATTHFYTGCIGAAIATLLLPFGWTAIAEPRLWAVLLLLGVFSTLGHFLLIVAYQRAPTTTVTPFLYVQIGFAVLGGWLVFSQRPDRWSLSGIALIAVSGAVGTWLAAREKHDTEALAAQPVTP
jgi:drug/metabolite transporter (DMT)-like permease